MYCKNRHFNCHSGCEKYIEYKNCFKSKDTEEQEYIGYVNGAISRMKGKSRWA
ncbi:hypothetical protein KQI42_06305 [Tissierella sp. MSJ-40]|uniref:Uncharacterized protein n=1 Tax=Tissierella simiarum TaxID=2841534 RepID=A0ABS6E3X5_9FIRM|nr:hypothetical protein [Tissierella simiarum]MBU5437610.1 hypothetical protein [Tissierella simiarum]